MGLDHALGWLGFNAFVLAMLALDLAVFNRKAHVISIKEAIAWSVVWIALALAFNAGLYLFSGSGLALQFLTGYVIEKSLSVDNLFVFLMIFAALGVPEEHQQRVLLWGVLGALVMRGGMIVAGVALLHRFHWLIFLFGGFLLAVGVRMAFQPAERPHLEHSPLFNLIRRVVAVTPEFHGGRFFVREGGRWMATPLFLALVVLELFDVIFAIDSVPAVFAVSEDPFIVYTSNVFAILGLRALYFALAGILERFRYFKYGLAAVLAFVGLKMLLSRNHPIPVGIALAVVACLLAGSVLTSLMFPEADREND